MLPSCPNMSHRRATSIAGILESSEEHNEAMLPFSNHLDTSLLKTSHIGPQEFHSSRYSPTSTVLQRTKDTMPTSELNWEYAASSEDEIHASSHTITWNHLDSHFQHVPMKNIVHVSMRKEWHRTYAPTPCLLLCMLICLVLWSSSQQWVSTSSICRPHIQSSSKNLFSSSWSCRHP